MKQIKRWLSLLLAALMLMSAFTGLTAYADDGQIGWVKEGKYYYYYADETWNYQDGPYEIDGKWYMFDGSGRLVTKKGWYEYKADAAWVECDYYYITKGGVLATGWKTIGGKTYCFDDSGRMYYGGSWEIDGKYYLLGNDGVLINKPGWQAFRYEGSKADDYWYFDKKGNMLTGWQKIDGKWYCFAEWGEMFKNGGHKTPDGKIYWFNKDGSYKKVYGWQSIKESYGDKTYTYYYYFGKNGYGVSGWQKIGGKWYYFLTYSGEMAAGILCDIDNATYYFDDNGQYQTGWQEINDNWYYFKKNGKAATGWTKIEGKKYYFSDGEWWGRGEMMSDGIYTIGKSLYGFDENGQLLTGWQTLDGSTYYFKKNGKAVRGVTKIGKKLYFFDKDYAFLYQADYGDDNGYTEWEMINGDTYLIHTSGKLFTGWYKEYDNYKMYFSPKTGKKLYGLRKIKGKYYYLDKKNNGFAHYGWKTIKGKKYYFRKSGAAAVGKVKIGGKYYTFDNNGVLQS